VQRLFLGHFLLAGSVQAQTVVGDHETLAFDRPEAWAMSFLAATTFLTAFGGSPRLAPWQWSIAGELGHIPHFSDTQRRIGFEDYLVLGGHYDLTKRWTLGTEILHVPLHLRRARAAARESDALTSLRIQVRFRSDLKSVARQHGEALARRSL
jgi:hypothetical protein